MTNDTRAAFEAWFSQQRTRFTGSRLSEKTKRLMEPAWLASRRVALEEAAKAANGEELIDPQDECDDAYNRAVSDCVSAIRALGN